VITPKSCKKYSVGKKEKKNKHLALEADECQYTNFFFKKSSDLLYHKNMGQKRLFLFIVAGSAVQLSFSPLSSSKKITANCFYEAAVQDIKAQDFKSAQKNIQTALRLDPDNEDYNVQLAYLYLWSKKTSTAINIFKKYPQNLDAQKGLAKGYLAEKKWNDAFEVLSKLQENNPNDETIKADLALYYFASALDEIKRSDFPLAEKKLERSLELNPQNQDAWIRLAYLYLWQERDQEAAQIFLRFPNDGDAQAGLARIEAKKERDLEISKRAQEAHTQWDDLNDQGKELLGLKKWNLAYRYYSSEPNNDEFRKKAAWALFKMGNLEEAKMVYLELFSLHPDDKNLKCALALILYQLAMDNCDQMISLLEEALYWDPENEDARIQLEILTKGKTTRTIDEKILARLAVDRKDFCTAYQLYKDLIHEDTDAYVHYLYKLGIFYRNNKKFKEAENAFLEALKWNPTEIDVRVQLANVYVDTKRWREAEAIYLDYPDYIEALKGYARFLRETDRLCAAFDVNERLFLEYPKDKEVLEGYARDFYLLGRWYHRNEWEDLAEEALRDALYLNPKHVDAKILLGSVLTGMKRFDEAALLFQEHLDQLDAQKGMARLLLEKELLPYAEALYMDLWKRNPCDQDIISGIASLYYKKGSFSYRRGCFWRARNELEYSLSLKGDNSDAEILLGNTYFALNRKALAYAFFMRNCTKDDAIEGLGRLALVCERWCEALKRYQYLYAKRGNDPDILLGLARAEAGNLYFCRAEHHYQRLYRSQYIEEAFRENFEVKRHTSPGASLDVSYIDAIEHDPQLRRAAARDFYFNSTVTAYVPINEQWRLDGSLFYGYQKELNVVRETTVNYDVGLAAAKILSRNWVTPHFDWIGWASVKRGWDRDRSSNFPFINTTRFEPGIGAIYRRRDYRLGANAYIDSFVIKNFEIRRSQLLSIWHLDADALARFECPLKWEIEAWIEARFYRDRIRNFRDEEILWLRAYVPCTHETLRAIFELDHSHFRKLTSNYFSYKKQWWPKVGGVYFNTWDRFSLELLYEHGWQFNYQLIMPIGDVLFISPFQKWLTDRFEAIGSYRICDRIRFELGGRYYRTTLPYRDWRVRGSVLFLF
jgi:tetratricopeptide (TPR) repeat protein